MPYAKPETLNVKNVPLFSIGDRKDYEYAKKMLDLLGSNPLRVLLHFSPVFGKLDPKILSEWIMEDHLDVRLHLQLHKVIWSQDQRGV